MTSQSYSCDLSVNICPTREPLERALTSTKKLLQVIKESFKLQLIYFTQEGRYFTSSETAVILIADSTGNAASYLTQIDGGTSECVMDAAFLIGIGTSRQILRTFS